MEPLRGYGVITLHLDITRPEDRERCIDTIIGERGRIDVLVNNAGYGFFGAIENVPETDARNQLEVNLFGLSELCRLVIPHMRAHGSGRIINISSVAGRSVLYFGGWYHVSKYAVEALSDALRVELKPFGIDTVLIEPGGIRTQWGIIAAEHLKASSTGTAYEKDALGEAAIMKKAYSIKLLSEPHKVAKAIVRAVEARRPRARYICGFGARTLLFFHSVLPAKWWDAINRTSVRKLGNKFPAA